MSSLTAAPDEYRAVTEACGLLDRSERGKLALTGGEAKSFLQGQITNDVEALTAGRGCYAAFLTPKGKMLGRPAVLDAGEELLLDTERSGPAGPVQHDPAASASGTTWCCTSARSSGGCSR